MRYEASKDRDIPIIEPGCPAARWDGPTDRTLSAPNIPVDLTGEHSITGPDKFYLNASVNAQDVQVTASFYTGEWLGIVYRPDAYSDPEVHTGEIVVTASTCFDVATREGYYVQEIAVRDDEEGNQAAIDATRDFLQQHVLNCRGPVDGICPAINSDTLREALSATIQQFYPTENA